MEEKEIIRGIINKYIYESSDSLYKVASLTKDNKEDIIIVGFFPQLEENLTYEFTGYFKEHTKYGHQFMVESYSKGKFNSNEGLILYLSSDKFLGIGPKTAAKIVDVLGNNAIELIINDKSSLDKVGNLPELKKDLIYNTLKDNYNSEQVFVELYSFGLSAKMVYKMYEKYSINAANKIKENPYRLIYEVDGFGFIKSDILALKIGFKEDDFIRIKEVLIYTLKTVCNQNGFTFLTDIQLINSATELLNKLTDIKIEIDFVKSILDKVIEDRILISEENRIYEKNLYDAEVKVANKIKLLDEKRKTDKFPVKEDILKALSEIEDKLKIKYTNTQKEAILTTLSSKLSIITGGPGTGKTTIIKGILQIYAKINKLELNSEALYTKVLMCAPTGRAAKRMSEATNHPSSTIHKALGYNYLGQFSLDEYNPLYQSLIIIDEASMIDIVLASNLFKAISFGAQIIIVGDENQLPSVGPGYFLHDIIESGLFKTIRLKEILRQAENSSIIKLSHQILNDHLDYSLFKEKKEIFFYDCDSKNVSDKIIQILDKFISSGGNLLTDIQILIPIYASIAGIDYINNVIQERYNKSKTLLVRQNKIFKVGDKVLQLSNKPELDIMNGDIGIIKDIRKIDESDFLFIEFDNKIIKYPSNQIDDLNLAYAISIHKSQGSEYKNVIVPIVPSYSIMLRKKIIYTAITRAKEKLIIIGKYISLLSSVKTIDKPRQTSLIRRLKDKDETIYINDPEIGFSTLGEENMEGITPYTFMK